MENHYRTHNQRMLESIMGDSKTHQLWTLKQAKRKASPALGKTFNSLRALRSLNKKGK